MGVLLDVLLVLADLLVEEGNAAVESVVLNAKLVVLVLSTLQVQ